MGEGGREREKSDVKKREVHVSTCIYACMKPNHTSHAVHVLCHFFLHFNCCCLRRRRRRRRRGRERRGRGGGAGEGGGGEGTEREEGELAPFIIPPT